MYYVEDGCQSEEGIADDFVGSFQAKSFSAGVRCCGVKSVKCVTLGFCPGDFTNYDDAASKCSSINGRLCTKEELLSDVCCGTGGDCDNWPVWTSTSMPGT